MAAKTTAAADSPPEGIRLRSFRMPANIVHSNSSGFVIGDVLEGGQISGSTAWIVATPSGVVVGIDSGSRIRRLVFTAAGYGEVE